MLWLRGAPERLGSGQPLKLLGLSAFHKEALIHFQEPRSLQRWVFVLSERQPPQPHPGAREPMHVASGGLRVRLSRPAPSGSERGQIPMELLPRATLP